MTAASAGRRATLPPLWIGCALLFWGVLTDHLVIAVILAVIAEAGVWSPLKWELTSSHFYRAADLASLLFALIAVYQFNEYSIYAIYRILALLPVCVFPLLLAERYSTTGALPASALFLSLRRRVREGFEPERHVGVAFPYLIVVTLAASATEISGRVYLVGAFVLVAGALLVRRSRRFGLPAWVASLAAVALLAFALQLGVRTAQLGLEDSFSYWVNQFAWFQTDPRRELTSIGSIGRLKLSDRIRVRVDAPLSIPLPLALHEASYSTFNLGTWSADGNSTFTAVDPLPQTTVWQLAPERGGTDARAASIVIDHGQDVGVAPLPYGTQRVEGAELIEVQRNPRGTTLVEALPGQLEYRVTWNDRHPGLSEPTAEDLVIPENYLAVIGKTADEIGLDRNDPARAAIQVKSFFREHFRYSLVQKGFYPGRTPLAHFLMTERKGHCEYFATATALLLRHAGIPTRYAVGYMVYEYSPLERAFVARARHAHSWVEAHLDGRWQVVDTTPGDWHELESANASGWQRVQDLWSWLANRYSRYQRGDRRLLADSALWLVPPLFVYLIWRLRSRARTITPEPRGGSAREDPGDSELHALARALERRGFDFAPGDTLRSFFTRYDRAGVAGELLERMLSLHERYRYSSRGLSSDERLELRRGSGQLRELFESRQ